MDPRKRNQAIREAAMERAKHTWVAETTTGVIVIAHPGQEVERDPRKLKQLFGIVDQSIVKLLCDSCEAPRPWSLDDEIRQARDQLEQLEQAKEARDRADAKMASEHRVHLDQLEAERSASTEPKVAGATAGSARSK